jgi:hypothetical protein
MKLANRLEKVKFLKGSGEILYSPKEKSGFMRLLLDSDEGGRLS